jgi:hypothetical protein
VPVSVGAGAPPLGAVWVPVSVVVVCVCVSVDCGVCAGTVSVTVVGVLCVLVVVVVVVVVVFCCDELGLPPPKNVVRCWVEIAPPKISSGRVSTATAIAKAMRPVTTQTFG